MATTPALEDTWRLEDIYETPQAFRAEKDRLGGLLPGLATHAGRLGGSARDMADALETITDAGKALARLHTYASMLSDQDLRVPANQAMRQEVELAFTEMSRRTAWLRPEILALPDGTVERFLSTEPRLAPFAHFLRNLVRQKAHVLSPAEEGLLAEAGLLMGGPSQVFGILNNAEMPRPTVRLEDGAEAVLTPARFALVRTSSVRDDRVRTTRAYFEAYAAFRETYGSNLFECLKSHLFRARARRYAGCLEAALDGDNVPARVYTNLIEQIHRALPSIHRYYRLRARALGLDELTYFDLHCPLVPGFARRYSVGDAKRLVIGAMAPLGDAYVAPLRDGLASRWIDWHPAPGKRSGAYASGGAYDVHPYMLLNYNGDFDSLSTLAHEAGHAMHSYFSNKTQPYASADYSIFVAEVASTFNEALLVEQLLAEANERDEKVFLLGHWLDGIRATLFRQTFFAEFEMAIHRRCEASEALTGESLSELYLELLRTYQGHESGACHTDDLFAIEWACVPHFYYDFYVYQYATGIVAANQLAAWVLEGVADARDRYLRFLTTGGSDYPLALLRGAGVDLEAREPYEATLRAIERKLDDLEALL